MALQSQYDESTDSLCRVCIDLTEVTGAAIVLWCGQDSQSAPCASDDVSAQIAELEFTYGEGPSIDACHGDHPVLEPNLADPASSRWVGFTRPAVEAGAQAVFSFPLRAGKKSFGALNLYRDRPGPLRGEQHADVLAMADVAAEAILRMWTPDSSSSATATRSSDFSSAQPVVHQAAGMLSAQLNVSVAEALVRLRGYACSQDRRLAEVASDVVRRVLRLEHD